MALTTPKNDMLLNEIIDWLTGIEESALNAYTEAAKLFKADEEVSGFLSHLADEEREHVEQICNAAELINAKGDQQSIISLDRRTREQIELPFSEFAKKIEHGELTRKELYKYLALIEFSELNHIFLYVINAAQGGTDDRAPAILSAIDEHKKHVEDFLRASPDGAEYLANVNFPVVQKKNILIVDDKAGNVNLLKAVLSAEGLIDTAIDGKEAMGKIQGTEFSAIITDVDMPVMDGIRLYSAIVEGRPELKERFIFFTASNDPERLDFFIANKLRHLSKPAPISTIRKTVREVLETA